MKNIRQSLVMLLGVAVIVTGLSIGHVHARDGSDSSQDTTAQQQSSDSNSSSEAAKKQQEAQAEADKNLAEQQKHDAEVATEQKNHDAEKAAELVKENAAKSDPEVENEVEDSISTKAKLIEDELRKEFKGEHTNDQRKANCQSEKQGLERKFSNYVTNAKKHKSIFDTILGNAIVYQQTNNINSSDLSGLINKAQAAGSKAASSISVLAGLSPSLDCNNVSVASDVAKFKAAVDQVRSDLTAYRDAIRSVLESLEQLSANGGL